MKLIASKYLNIRLEKPSTGSICRDYFTPGKAIEVSQSIVGQKLDGNSIWYKINTGEYCWSGGIDQIEWILEGCLLTDFNLKDQYTIVSEAKDYYFERFKKHGFSITGMSVAYKKQNSEYKNYYALTIHVDQKISLTDQSTSIPATLAFRGIQIITDVIQASVASSSSLGESISRNNKMLGYGTAGFIAKKKGDTTNTYLVTNYHVLCADLMLTSPRTLAADSTTKIVNRQVLSPAFQKTVGTLIEGRLDAYNDVSLVKLDAGIEIDNTLPGIGSINGTRGVSSIVNNLPNSVAVFVYGARGGYASGKIISFNATIDIKYLNGEYIHSLGGLIQANKFTTEGDSGSAIVDENNMLIGIVVAASDDSTYIIPIENILFNFKLTLS